MLPQDSLDFDFLCTFVPQNSMPVCHQTSFPPSTWFIIRPITVWRSLLWAYYDDSTHVGDNLCSILHHFVLLVSYQLCVTVAWYHPVPEHQHFLLTLALFKPSKHVITAPREALVLHSWLYRNQVIMVDQYFCAFLSWLGLLPMTILEIYTEAK